MAVGLTQIHHYVDQSILFLTSVGSLITILVPAIDSTCNKLAMMHHTVEILSVRSDQINQLVIDK